MRMPLEVGQAAPDFAVPSHTGDVVTKAGLTGKIAVLFFYPKDGTPGCTNEATDFRDHLAEFAEAGAVVYGVSRNSVESHRKFAAKHGLNMPLLADVDGAMCTAFGVLQEKTLFGKTGIGIVRTTFVLAPDGTVAYVFPKVKVAGHVQAVLEAVRALASGAPR
jgi:peroxiredoxin Q/BCP